MSLGLLPELAREGSERLAREAETWRTGAPPRRVLAEMSRTLLELARLYAAAWGAVLARLSEGGCEARALSRACRSLLEGGEALAGVADLLLRAAADPEV